jgi:ubiquinone/menaquinone biosynthesis C-methylase UbiE
MLAFKPQDPGSAKKQMAQIPGGAHVLDVACGRGAGCCRWPNESGRREK